MYSSKRAPSPPWRRLTDVCGYPDNHVFGYGVGLDMTRRDMQGEAKKTGRSWEMGKAFDESAPCAALKPVAMVGHPAKGVGDLTVKYAK